jgi:hypothetical protein
VISRVNYLLDSIEWNSSLQQLIKMNTKAVLPNVQGHALLLTWVTFPPGFRSSKFCSKQKFTRPPGNQFALPTAAKKFLGKRRIIIANHHRTSLIS